SRKTPTRQVVAPLHILELGAYGGLFFLVALVFDTSLEVQFTLPKLLIIRAAIPVLAAVWALRLACHQVKPLPRSIAITGAAFAAWLIVTTIFAVHQPTALHGAHGRYNGLWNQAICLFIFFIVATSHLDVAQIERLLRVMLAALVPVALYALVQFAGWDPIVWPVARSASTIGNP